MQTKNPEPPQRISLQVSTNQRPNFKEALSAYVFDERGELVEKAEIREGKVELTRVSDLHHTRVFLAPQSEKLEGRKPTIAMLERMGAYEPVLQGPNGLLDRITVPGIIIDRWPFCFCYVRGRVVRASDNRAVCNARVHICEVDRIPNLILQLPELELVRLRDDLLEIIRNPPKPKPKPDPDPGPLFRMERNPASAVTVSPQPEPPRGRSTLQSARLSPAARVALNPQPLPPRESFSAANLQTTAASAAIPVSAELLSGLQSTSNVVVRDVLVRNWKLIVPWLCLWPWWWWRFRCDEVAVLTTDAHGRFETTLLYSCSGDQPDLYFWVEFDFGSGFETVYHPWIACHTYWNYACGTEVTIRVTDPRVPGCEEEPDLPGCQVVVLSLGRIVAVREVQTSGATEGLTSFGEPFGATLEPRVDFSRTELIVNKNIPYYRWSYRRLTAPDGGAGPVDVSSVPLGTWSVMTRDVYRHYKDGTTYPSERMGPMPTSGVGAAPLPNLFRIRPEASPSGGEWMVLDETVDLATAYFDTDSLAGAPGSSAPATEDLAAGRYELKLELFTAAGALVNWTAAGIDLRITDQDAPFGVGPITTSPAPAYNRIISGGDTMGFRMVVRVDNNRCYAEILPVGGMVTPDPLCGFHNYNSPSDTATLSFVARHPNHFATYSFVTTRATAPVIPGATTSGTAGEPGTNLFNEVTDFEYAKDVVISTLLGACSNAAFSERLDVMAMAINGYGTLTGYNRAANAAFALAVPCGECECEQSDADA